MRPLVVLAALFFLFQAYSNAQESAPLSALKEVTIFFDSGGTLKPEIRSISKEKSVESEIKSVVEELIKGSETYTRTLPESARLRRVFLDKLKTVYLDFNMEFAKNHPGGISTEIITLASLCRSIFANFDVNAVQILSEGKKLQTLAGHIDIESPLTRSRIQRWLVPRTQ